MCVLHTDVSIRVITTPAFKNASSRRRWESVSKLCKDV